MDHFEWYPMKQHLFKENHCNTSFNEIIDLHYYILSSRNTEAQLPNLKWVKYTKKWDTDVYDERGSK